MRHLPIIDDVDLDYATRFAAAIARLAEAEALLGECRIAMIAQGNALNWEGVIPEYATAINKIREHQGELPAGWDHDAVEGIVRGKP
jgi:hypothetical protein